MSSRAYWPGVAAAVVSLPAAALTTAWLAGDLSYRGPETDLDYAVQPLPVGDATLAAAGVFGVVVLLAAVAVVVLRAGRAWPVLACLAAAGVLIGGGYRVLTAGVVGANIGAGLVLLFGLPAMLALLLTGAVLAVRRKPTAGR